MAGDAFGAALQRETREFAAEANESIELSENVRYSPKKFAGFVLYYLIRSIWCGWRDLNPHAFRRQNLNLVRLPISPHPQAPESSDAGAE